MGWLYQPLIQHTGANSNLQLVPVMCRWGNYIFKFGCSGNKTCSLHSAETCILCCHLRRRWWTINSPPVLQPLTLHFYEGIVSRSFLVKRGGLIGEVAITGPLGNCFWRHEGPSVTFQDSSLKTTGTGNLKLSEVKHMERTNLGEQRWSSRDKV